MKIAVALTLLATTASAEPPYDRHAWEHWNTRGDCIDTRQEVLLTEGEDVELQADGCRVVAGRWTDPFDGREHTDPGALHIDHLVPLKNAHESGGAAWAPAVKRAFANDLLDPDHLVAVRGGRQHLEGRTGARRVEAARSRRVVLVRARVAPDQERLGAHHDHGRGGGRGGDAGDVSGAGGGGSVATACLLPRPHLRRRK